MTLLQGSTLGTGVGALASRDSRTDITQDTNAVQGIKE